MQQSFSMRLIARLIALVVLVYGFEIIIGSLLHQFRVHPRHDIGGLLAAIPLLSGLGCLYLANLLRREKYNAWICAIGLFAFILCFDVTQNILRDSPDIRNIYYYDFVRFVVPALLLLCLMVTRSAFRVKSDMRGFKQAVRVSALLLSSALLYGVIGFSLLDNRDFRQEISIGTAIYQTIDQFGLTTSSLHPYTRRAKVFESSLSIISVGALVYTAVSLFQPLRMKLINQDTERQKAERMLERSGSDIDDFFKLWPHDKLYFFDSEEQAGLAYHVSRGVALIVGDPFGKRASFEDLLLQFGELCFVNDWLAAFIHVSDVNRVLYTKMGFRIQKIGEEAILNLKSFVDTQTGKSGKYFRQIRNRFEKLGYNVEVLQPPHNQAVLMQLRQISNEWLEKPGREERGFMLGYHNDDYFQRGPLAVVCDESKAIQGFINVVPTFQPNAGNYDLLRCTADSPGNCNDFLLMGLIDHLIVAEYTVLNLGLSPLAGLDNMSDSISSKDSTIVDSALRFFYSNGDRFYSFNGLHRFKDKYNPSWEPRYIAYQGGISAFTRIMTALNRAMKLK